jgi:hypothetical protein
MLHLDVGLKTGKIVFGVPLHVAVENSRLNDYSELPAVVYRCIEYLEARNGEEYVFQSGFLFRVCDVVFYLLAKKNSKNGGRDIQALWFQCNYSKFEGTIQY